MTAQTLDLLPLATRSLRSIFDITDHVGRHYRPEATRTVKRLFDLLAWSDGKLDPEETSLFDHLCADVPAFGEHCEDFEDYDPIDPTLPETPPLLAAVVEHDRRTGERLAPVLVSSLETIGHAVIGATGIPIDSEKQELYTYVDSMRRLIGLLKYGGTAVPR